MQERTIAVMNSSGLHARPAASFVKLASAFISDISIEHKRNRANGKSIVEMMMVAADRGDRITIRVSGADEQATMDALVKFVSGEHDNP